MTASQAGFLDKIKSGLDKIGTETGTSSGTTSSPANLSIAEISQGLKEALRVGAGKVVAQLGTSDGFNLDPTAHIPLSERWMLHEQQIS